MIDGFLALPGGAPASLALTLEDPIPRLVEAGLFRAAYEAEDFAGHLDGG